MSGFDVLLLICTVFLVTFMIVVFAGIRVQNAKEKTRLTALSRAAVSSRIQPKNYTLEFETTPEGKVQTWVRKIKGSGYWTLNKKAFTIDGKYDHWSYDFRWADRICIAETDTAPREVKVSMDSDLPTLHWVDGELHYVR